MLDVYALPLGQAVQPIRDILAAGLVPMLRGSPGIGKSAVIHAVAAAMDYLVIDLRFAGFDPTDLQGFPGLDQARGMARYYPLDVFPLAEQHGHPGTQLPINPATGQPYAGWLIFCDELTSAAPAVQAASYKFFLDRHVGPFKLHEKAHIIGAGNLDSDNAITVEMSTALINRMINLTVTADLDFWLKWAQGGGGRIRSIITSYLEWKTAAFYTFDADNPNQPFASARSWEFVNKLLDVWSGNPLGKESVLAGAINATATDFTAFASLRASLPRRGEIENNPDTARVPDSSDPGPCYALTGALGDWFDVNNADKMMKYISRLPNEFQVITVRNIVRRQGQAIMGHPDVSQWMMANADEFMG